MCSSDDSSPDHAPWRLYDDGTVVVDSGLISWSHAFFTVHPLNPWGSDRVNRVVFSGPVVATHSITRLFDRLWNVTTIEGLCYFDTGSTRAMDMLFVGSNSLTSLDISNWDTSNVVTMAGMFSGMRSLTYLNISDWDTRNVIDMWLMFDNASSLVSLDLSGWYISDSTRMSGMFDRTTSLRKLTLGENFRFNVSLGNDGYEDAALPPVPDNQYFTGVWQNVGEGTVGNPLGEFEFTSEELMEYYDGAIHADTWVWQPRNHICLPIAPCIDCGENVCCTCVCEPGICFDDILVVTPSPINFGSIQHGRPNPGAIPITITNTGDVELTLNPLPQVAGFTFGNLPNPILQPGQSRTVAVNVNANLQIGTHNTIATITTVEGASATVELRFIVTAPQNNNNNNNQGSWNNNRPSGNVFTRPPTSSNNATTNNNAQPPAVQQFTDVSPNDWFYAYVQSAVASGLLNGVGNGEFAPHAATTRAMFVTVLWRLAGSPNGYNGGDFSDVVNDSWYSDAIAWAAVNEIVSGVGNGEFAPNLNITREQMGLILYRYVGELVDEIMDRNYAPQNTATRAEMAAVMLRLSER